MRPLSSGGQPCQPASDHFFTRSAPLTFGKLSPTIFKRHVNSDIRSIHSVAVISFPLHLCNRRNPRKWIRIYNTLDLAADPIFSL